MRRRIAIAATLTGVGVLAARALGPKLHERLVARCESMFERMPDNLPPKRIMRGVEEVRGNTARILELLEEGGRTPPGAEEPGDPRSSTTVSHAA